MIELSNLKLVDLLPSSITGSEEIVAIAGALDKELQAITACINEIIMIPNIDEMPEDIVDHLAGQFHVDYYEPLGLDLDKKRALVKSSLSWHRRKGTKSVLEEVIRILFLDDFAIEEWYEYGGEPYFFRLILNNTVLSLEQYRDLIRAVYELKNVRSWLEYIRVKLNSLATVYVAGISHWRAHGVIPLSVISPKGSTQGTVYVMRVDHRHIRHTVPITVDRAIPAAAVSIAERNHLHITHQIGGAINACNYS